MSTRMHWRARAGLIAGLAGLVIAAPSPAHAWDPSTTHQALLEAAVTRSAIHLRWMDATALERGLFSALRLDPAKLDPAELRLLRLAIREAHADSGAVPLGGPGACPSASAPAQTQLFCVDGDLYEHSALGWLRLGMLAEVTPTARHIHHFLDREQLDAERWRDRELPAQLLRTRQARSNGEPRAGVATRTNFDGEAPTALSWLEDPDDPLAPPQTFAHLAAASLAASPAERDHALALALVGVGALIHVVQDLSVPAHARGDASAFFAPLSAAAGDRGLPLQEFVRVEYGRGELPGISRPSAGQTPGGVPLATSLLGHLLGDPETGYEGLAQLAARRYLSESSVPQPKFLDPGLDPTEAAAALLGEQPLLDPVELEGATLSPWPAERGYLLSPTGRALAAFDTDLDGRIRPYLDETCYRDAAAVLLPAAAEVTRSLLDLLWPAWPASRQLGGELSITVPNGWDAATLTVLIEDAAGQRRVVGEHPLAAGAPTTVTLGVDEALHRAPAASGGAKPAEHVVLVLQAQRPGVPLVLEQRLDALAAVTSSGSPSRPAAGAESPDERPDERPFEIEVQPFTR